MTDDVVDYEFALAKNLGARAIDRDCRAGDEASGQFADKQRYGGPSRLCHDKRRGLRNRLATPRTTISTSATCRRPEHLTGPVQAAPQPDPTSIKDRKMINGPNVPFGQGDTPIKVLQLIRDNKRDIQPTPEFEYPIPEVRPDDRNKKEPRLRPRSARDGADTSSERVRRADTAMVLRTERVRSADTTTGSHVRVAVTGQNWRVVPESANCRENVVA
jgi:hypothetical protein